MANTQHGHRRTRPQTYSPRFDVHESTNLEITLQATPSGKWQYQEIDWAQWPSFPTTQGWWCEKCAFSHYFSVSQAFFPSIITCPRDWVTVVQSAGKGSLFDICWVERWEEKALIIESYFPVCSCSLAPGDSMLTGPYPPFLFLPMASLGPVLSNPP